LKLQMRMGIRMRMRTKCEMRKCFKNETICYRLYMDNLSLIRTWQQMVDEYYS